jgi:C1A family cysteine protease
MKIHTYLFASLLMAGMLGGIANASESGGINVEKTKDTVAVHGARFTVKENWLTKLPLKERKRVLGLSYLPNRQLKHAAARPMTPAPTSVDWRNMNGVNWVGPVLDQGQCGSCVAFATVGTLETQYSIANGQTWLHPSFSPQMLFNCGGASCDMGWDPDSSTSYLQKTGIADEACMPYTSGLSGTDVSCSAKCSDSAARTIKITGSSSGGSSIEDVKAALTKGPLVTTLDVYADFEAYSTGVYKHVDDGSGPEGGHAVSIIGYDDSKNAWLIRNSWNTSWGEAGFGWVDYDDVSGVGGETWHLNITPSKSLLAVQVPGDHAVVSDVVSSSVEATGVTTANAKLMVADGTAKNVTAAKAAATCPSSSTGTCDASFDTHSLTDGLHTAYSVSSDGKTKSQVHAFYVLNTAPTLSLKLTPKTGTDFTKPLSGTVYLEGVLSTGSSVPMDQVTRHIYDSKGNDIADEYRIYTILSPNMEFGWTTTQGLYNDSDHLLGHSH